MSDALSSLRSVLAPQKGMKRIPFPTESYQHPSLPLSAKRLLNVFVEQQPADARTEAALLTTPGMQTWITAGDGPIWAVNNDQQSFWYIVSGTKFYRYTNAAPPALPNLEMLGDVGSPSVPGRFSYLDMITVAVGKPGAVVVVPPNAFVCTNSAATVDLIGGTWPDGGASSVAFLDDYYVFTSPTSGQFFISRLADPTLFDALDFATNDGGGDVRVMAVNGELWFGSPGGFEIWYDSGDADFPFRPRRSARISQGVGAPQSMAVGDGSLFWLGIDGIVYRSDGYRAVRISTHGVESVTQAIGTLVESAFCTTHRGHIFYVLNYPGRTLAYDCSTKQWADRASSLDGSGRWRGNATASIEIDQSIVGDRISGKIFQQIEGFGDEDGVNVLRQVIMPQLWAGTNREFCNRLEVEMETGVAGAPGSMVLDWSNDGGITWTGGPRTLNTGSDFNRQGRVYTNRLGSFRQRVFRLTWHGHATIFAVDADMTGPPQTSGG